MVETAAISIVVFALGISLDWLISTRLAAYYVDSEFQYQPGILRYVILVILAFVFSYTYSQGDASHVWMPGLVTFLALVFVYVFILVIDVRRALAEGKGGPPPNYSDRN